MSLRALADRFPVTRGAGVFVLLMTALLLGRMTGLYDFYEYLGLSPEAVWRGQVWRLATYPLLPFGPIDLLVGGWAVIWLGAWLERIWSPLECWLYGMICTLAAGAAACLLFPRFPGLLGGTAILVAGLLVAWARLAGHERVLAAPGWEMQVRTVALGWGFVLLFVAWFSCGRWFALPMLAASVGGGWLYLSLRWWRLHRRSARAHGGRRMSRLEL